MRRTWVWIGLVLLLFGCEKLPDVIPDTGDSEMDIVEPDLMLYDTGDAGVDVPNDSDIGVDLSGDVEDGQQADGDMGADANDVADLELDIAPPDPCEVYCQVIMGACAGDDAQFASDAACLEACAISQWSTGVDGELDGNTLACRMSHAALAAQDPATHCSHAGLGGGDVCGTWCENYCSLTDTVCEDWAELYPDQVACASACALASQDALPCRLDQALLAGSTGDGLAYCAEASADRSEVCRMPADVPGDDCATAPSLGGLPLRASGDTAGLTDASTSAEGCPGLADSGATGPDAIYRFTPPTSGVYGFELVGEPTLLYVASDCADVANTCLGGLDTREHDVLWLTLDDAASYLVFVDGRTSIDAGTYTLRVTTPCTPSCEVDDQCGYDGCGGLCGQCSDPDVCDHADRQCKPQTDVSGDRCDAPFSISGLPYQTQGDTRLGTTNTMQAEGCGIVDTTGAAEPDHIYAFDVPTWFYQLQVDPEALFDVALYVTADCATVDGSTCAGGADGFEGGGSETLELPLTAGRWYAVIDGFQWLAGDGAGAYRFQISPLPATCERYCRTITSRCLADFAQYADEGACIDACAAATWPVGAPASASGDTLSCRLVHAIEAGATTADIAISCGSAGPTGGASCVGASP